MAILVRKQTYLTEAGQSADAGSGRLPQTLEVLSTRIHVAVGETLYAAGDVADSWYRVSSGAACESVQTADGRRQILDFLLPGDLFGFCSRPWHEFSVNIIAEGTTFARYPARRSDELASVDAEVAWVLRQRAIESIARLQSRMVLLGRTNALEKVSAFLLEMADRTSIGCADALVLPMSRYDIADYLAMAVETVSRALTTLKAQGAITVSNSRQVLITDRRALEHRARESLQRCSSAIRMAADRQRRHAPPSTPSRQGTLPTSCS